MMGTVEDKFVEAASQRCIAVLIKWLELEYE